VVFEPTVESVEEVTKVVEEVTETVQEIPVEKVEEEIARDEVIEVVEERVDRLVKVKQDIVNATLNKYQERIKARLPSDEQAQIKAMELFRKRIEEIVEETIAEKKGSEES
ncbi:MAG: hypothetical protein KAU62_00585, partial [Candidatus Heimdallarchaeota archaeon]|nr:hypothetical protein [Candidatus Heimdallarchaeota archaeon]MCK4609628.1 hypothetical protein [Candidatus Heimdallarchaeota archaeon]